MNDVLLEQLSDNGNGTCAYVDDLDEARKLFVEDLTSALQVIALDATPAPLSRAVPGRFRWISTPMWWPTTAELDMRTGMSADGCCSTAAWISAMILLMLVRLAPPNWRGHSAPPPSMPSPSAPTRMGRIATVQLRWEDPDTHEVTEINGNFNTWDLAESFEQADPRYQLAVVVAQYAQMLRRSFWAAETDGSQLVKTLTVLIARI